MGCFKDLQNSTIVNGQITIGWRDSSPNTAAVWQILVLVKSIFFGRFRKSLYFLYLDISPPRCSPAVLSDCLLAWLLLHSSQGWRAYSCALSPSHRMLCMHSTHPRPATQHPLQNKYSSDRSIWTGLQLSYDISHCCWNCFDYVLIMALTIEWLRL